MAVTLPSQSGAGRTPGWLPVILALFLLPACQQDSPDAPFEVYLERLGRTLGVMVPALAPTPLLKPPRSAALQLELAGSKLDTLDFLALHGCALQVTIGKRNSILGRMARPSQRLLLELEFLRLAPACAGQLREQQESALAQLLEQAWQQKREQLPARIFNATLGSPEYRAFWSASRAAGEYPRVADNLAIDALKAINKQVGHWLQGDFSADGTQFELWLGEVAGGDGGAVMRSLQRQSDWLWAADDMLSRRRAQGPLCEGAFRQDAATILPQVVQKFFIAGIQPRAAHLNGRFYALMPPVQQLEQQLQPALPRAYRDWQRERNEQQANALAAPRRHVKQLQQIQAPCKQ